LIVVPGLVTPPGAPTWLALAAGFAVLLTGLGVRLLVVPAFDAPVLVKPGQAARPGSITDRLFGALGRPALPLVRRFTGTRGRRRLAARLAAAGRSGTVDRFLRLRAGGIVAGAVVGGAYLLTGSTLVGLLLAAGLIIRADFVLWSAARRRQDDVERTLPDLLDVLTVTITAGASFRLGLARVSEAFSGALPEELTVTLRQLTVGIGRRQAFEELRDRNTSPSLRRFVAAVLQAEELGTSLSSSLTDLSIDMRKLATQHARRRADSADKTIALITTLILLPAMILLVLSVFFGSIHVGG
jgi:tight adherence protein C